MNTDASLTSILSANLVYDYINVNTTNASSSERYVYRVQQTSETVQGRSVPQLTLTLWFGELFRILHRASNV